MRLRRTSRLRQVAEFTVGSVVCAAVMYGLLFIGGIAQLLAEGAR